jgi:hypothetical protein
MEDNEDADSKKSEAPNLGKLEYSLDYDFQKQEVNKFHLMNQFFFHRILFSLKLKLFKLKNYQLWI